MVIKNKRGWIRILEAVIAIMLLSSVLIYLYVSNVRNNTDFSNYVYDVQVTVLEDIASNNTLREYVVTNNNVSLQTYIEFVMPSNLNFTFVICEIGDPICSPNPPIQVDKDIYVEERIISATLTQYSPKVLRLFVWQK